MIRVDRLGAVQRSALEIHFFDPCHLQWAAEHPEDLFPGYMDGTVLVIADRDVAYRMLVDEANECDAAGDYEFRDALQKIAARVLRA